MEPWVIVVIVASIVIVAAIVWLSYERSRSQRLRTRFGPEYDRAVREFGSRRRAEMQLARRESRARELRDRHLNPADRDRFLEQWKLCQAQFVDDPAGALERAEQLLDDVMRTRGFSSGNPLDRMTDIAAAYPEHAGRYREACQIAAQQRTGETSTEELRRAFLHYRTLFDDLIGGYHEELRRVS
ncbi:MAG TPA: hypothetical protein VFR18_09425 [Terriglobia bacterium]|nr:hypothetical protein [Terriglobia bacterium]